MTGDPETPQDYKVGYGRPPTHARFQKGQSGNPAGRPKKRGAVAVDLDGILNGPVPVTQNGRPCDMPTKEVTLRRILKKATSGDLKSIIYLLDLFERHGAIDWPEVTGGGGVLLLPSTMPWNMAVMMVTRFGETPWTKHQLDIGRAAYLASRTDDERREDEIVEYPDL